ncbi:MAG TPA: ECF-type sigma factor [Longimicrobiales bacterium]
MQSSAGDVTVLLRQWADGDRDSLDRLVPLLYAQLRELAHRRLRGEDALHSLNTTALVHEAYLRLVGVHSARFRDRAHFMAMAARVMRRLLVDHARARRAAKRGAGAAVVGLSDELAEVLPLTDEQAGAIAELDDALERLARVDERQSRILEQRYFGGLSLEETAEAVGVSLATVKRELRFARAWLAAELRGDPAI